TNTTPCATCGRRAAEAGHILGGGTGSVCDHCMAELARDRRKLLLDEPEARCSLCDKNNLEARHVYGFRGVNVCNECLELSLGQAEREEIERYLATW
ncbi:MAG: hypothetical protein GWP91_02610, partial [Rhodobacterales bacterium]|nr:hypothetical protein [Rhodobacterales bacterium]